MSGDDPSAGPPIGPLILDDDALGADRGAEAADGSPNRGRPLGAALLAAAALAGLVLLGSGRTGDRSVGPPIARPATVPVPVAPIPADPGPFDPARRGDGPVLDEPVGLVMAVGGGDQGIHLVDLDTGAVSPVEGDGTPSLIHDDHLLVHDADGRWRRIDLATGRSAPIETGTGVLRASAAVRAEGDGVWFRRTGTGDRADWSRIEPTTGAVLQEVELPPGALVLTSMEGVPIAGPEIVSDNGGVLALDADGHYRGLTDGHLVAWDRDRLLMADCDGAGCTNRWIDRATLDPLDLPAPEAILAAGVIRGGELLLSEVHNGSTGIVKAFDIPSGRAIATGSPSGLARSWISPSGRFLAMPGFNALLVTRTAGGPTTAITRFTLFPDTRLVWGPS